MANLGPQLLSSGLAQMWAPEPINRKSLCYA
jgi:hypothetical protein